MGELSQAERYETVYLLSISICQLDEAVLVLLQAIFIRLK